MPRRPRHAGLTAYYGLFEIGEPKEGETVFVSGAAGAVGSTAGQMAKIAGCRVIGSAGSQEKLEWLRELGFDEVVRLPRATRAGRRSRELAPDGIDIYFDNVGGDHLEAAIGALRKYGRVVACGSISRYNDVEPTPGPRNMFMVVTKRLLLQGFIISDHFDRFPDFLAGAPGWVRDGLLRYRETVIEGIENAPRRIPRAASRREHREDARQGRPHRVKLAAGSSATACRGGRPFFLTERYQRCERCVKRIAQSRLACSRHPCRRVV